MKTVFIINSKANSKEIQTLLEKIKQYDPKSIIEWTQYSNHALEIAQKYAVATQENIHLFACGGDGLIHEVVNGIVGYDHILFSIIPIGTGNDFIKSLKPYKKKNFWDLKKYKDSILYSCDVMKINEEYAINTISFGFDVHVAKAVNYYKNKTRFKGILPYYFGMLRSLNQPLDQSCQIKIDHKKWKRISFAFLVLCNGSYYGGGYLPCPNAKWNDGWIDLCIIHDVKKLQILRFSKLYQKGEHIEKLSEYVQIERGKTIKIDSDNCPIAANLDGEIRELVNPVITILPNAITLCLPNLK